MFDVRPSLIRYWEQEFDILKPHRNKKGNRLFTPADVDNLRMIYHLLKEKKMKIEVARKYLRENKKEVNRDAEIVERLMSIRATLVQIKQDMLDGTPDDDYADDGAAYIAAVPKSDCAEVKPKPAAVPVNAVAAPPEAEVKPDGAQAPAQERPEGTGNLFGTEFTENGEFNITREVLTVSDIIEEEEANGEKPPFQEQMLFEVVTQADINPDLLIDSFIEKFDDESDEEEPAVDPFASLDAAAPRPEEGGEKPKQTVVEQTLF